YDRYYQIVKCFRDEDLRADRQPEFTQIDIEMSFVTPEKVIGEMERLMASIFKEAMGVEITLPIKQLSYAEAVSRFGLDAPDTRFALELQDMTNIVKDTGFKVFADIAKKGGLVKALNAKGCATFSRKDIDGLTELGATYGGKGLAWVKMTWEDKDGGWQSPIAKFFTDEEKKAIEKELDAEAGDLLLFSADKASVANTVLGRIRLELGKRLKLIPEEGFSFVWIVDWPMFEYDETDKRFYAMHHPFTAPRTEDIDNLEKDPGSVHTNAYDLVLNGEEIGGGSVRIHDPELQKRVFRALGIDEEEARAKFGFLLDALSFGTPPHGGIAFGLDRILAIMTKSESIRDVIAFPKTQKAVCPLSEAPSGVDNSQMEELFLRVIKKPG
ncbi:MAG: aspartate--tRNA ligase, partial [Deltaproteobacteria bacterium]|nr:aspartate--tRNA ligase [Deltaproteobacteria bacterium]